MARVKRNTAKLLLGIRGNDSGTLLNLKFSRNDRVNLLDESPHVKRPNQYKEKMQ
jgi:hypothetical protein